MRLKKMLGAVVAAGSLAAGAATLHDVQAISEHRPGLYALGAQANVALVRRVDASDLDAFLTMIEGGEETVFAY